MSKKNVKAPIEIEIGTGNVFEQLGLPNPEERLRKARLMNVINAVLKRRGLSQKDAAEAMRLHQADISRIQHGRGARYSTDRLLNILARLKTDVEFIQRHGTAAELVIEVRELSHV
jgi:predicted XRE-type DNA-binding protein